jgi:hypothetical protein
MPFPFRICINLVQFTWSNIYNKENITSPELYFRKTAIAREVTLDSQDAVKFLSILLSKKILITIGTRKNTEFMTVFKEQLCPRTNICVAHGHTPISWIPNLKTHISSSNYFLADNFHVITPNPSYSTIQRFPKDVTSNITHLTVCNRITDFQLHKNNVTVKPNLTKSL